MLVVFCCVGSATLNTHRAGDGLNEELDGWLEAVVPSEDFPVAGSKAIIAPFVPCYIVFHQLILRYTDRHAGYSYSGPAAAWAYKSIDTTGM